LYENTGSWYTQLLDLGALEPVGDARALASKPAAIASGGGMYLLAWSEVAERISETTGASLDLQPIVYTGYWPGTPRAVFVDGTFQLAWENQNDLYGSRIQASDGTVLDADTDTASGSKLLCSDCLADYLCGAVRKANLSLSLLGSDVVVSWPGVTSSNGCISSTALYGVRVDPAT